MKRAHRFITAPDARHEDEQGMALVEMMVSIVVLSILMIGVMDAMATCRRQTTAAQNQLVATNICQTLMDCARDQNWATLNLGANKTHLTMTGAALNCPPGGIPSGLPTYITRPLLTDATNNRYAQIWDNAGNGINLFPGTVEQWIEDSGTANQLLLTVRVSWPAETAGRAGSLKSLVQSTMISSQTLHN